MDPHCIYIYSRIAFGGFDDNGDYLSLKIKGDLDRHEIEGTIDIGYHILTLGFKSAEDMNLYKLCGRIERITDTQLKVIYKGPFGYYKFTG